MSSWRPLAAGTLGLFLIILAFLAGQLKGGSDPGLRQTAAAATSQPATQATPEPQGDFGTGAPDGAAPDLAPPTTRQS